MAVSLLIRVLFWLWFGAALAAGHFLVLQRVSALALPALTLFLAALPVLAYLRIGAIRSWVDAVDLRALVLLHVTRLAAIYLLVLHQRGEMPRALVMPGALGEIIVAVMALPVALAPLADAARHRAIVIWNVVGLVGLLLAQLNAVRLALAAPADVRVLTTLPVSLLPTFLVPLLLATHVVILARTRRAPSS
ncbi:MAG: hypothetical protein JNL92_22700 [Opitutaceae bacterium]|nr:hypothetical protein [Opitutaceae bacterium]